MALRSHTKLNSETTVLLLSVYVKSVHGVNEVRGSSPISLGKVSQEFVCGFIQQAWSVGVAQEELPMEVVSESVQVQFLQ